MRRDQFERAVESQPANNGGRFAAIGNGLTWNGARQGKECPLPPVSIFEKNGCFASEAREARGKTGVGNVSPECGYVDNSGRSAGVANISIRRDSLSIATVKRLPVSAPPAFGGMEVPSMSGGAAVVAPVKPRGRFAESGKLGGGAFYLCPSCGLINSCFGSCRGLSVSNGLVHRHEKQASRLLRNLGAVLVVVALLSCMVLLSGCAAGDPVFTASSAHRGGWVKFEPSRIPPPWVSP